SRTKSGGSVAKARVAKAQAIKQLAAQIKLTNPDKELDLSSKLTKAQLAIYYVSVAENLLPHIRQRPISIVRCPEGTKGQCFFQKHLTRGHPPGFEGMEIQERRGTRGTYITISSAEGLLGLAQLGVLEVHPWGSCVQTLEMPDRLTFDLDPGDGIEWKTLV